MTTYPKNTYLQKILIILIFLGDGPIKDAHQKINNLIINNF
jgi:hypothetical protein